MRLSLDPTADLFGDAIMAWLIGLKLMLLLRRDFWYGIPGLLIRVVAKVGLDSYSYGLLFVVPHLRGLIVDLFFMIFWLLSKVLLRLISGSFARVHGAGMLKDLWIRFARS